MITLKTPQETAKMRAAGRVVAEILSACRAAVRPGVTTGELDRIAADILKRHGATSNFKGYGVPVLPPFPGVICTSVNEQIVHGIPGKRRLKEGDIVSIDAGAIVDGWHADAAVTVPVGEVSPQAAKLIAVTDEALRRAIGAAVNGKRLGDIRAAVQRFVEGQGFTVVRNYVGHGIGRAMHEEPQVPNFGEPGRGPQLKPGMVIAVEPMVTMGSYDVKILADGWTAVTRDRSLSAQFEHSIGITETGCEIFTKSPTGRDQPPY